MLSEKGSRYRGAPRPIVPAKPPSPTVLGLALKSFISSYKNGVSDLTREAASPASITHTPHSPNALEPLSLSGDPAEDTALGLGLCTTPAVLTPRSGVRTGKQRQLQTKGCARREGGPEKADWAKGRATCWAVASGARREAKAELAAVLRSLLHL